jgi:predicted esterase
VTDTQVSREPDSNLTYRWQPAEDPDSLSFLMFHGLTGNEDVMWILQSALPAGGFFASPRAPFELAADKSFSWVPPAEGDGFQRTAYEGGLHKATLWVKGVIAEHDLVLGRTVFVGFSQGSALSFLLAGRVDTCPAAVVSLAGFLPKGELKQLQGLPVFWGHGSQDQTIPVERAHQDVKRLKALGAEVHYCEAEVGHKVGVECMRGLKEWLGQVI